MRSTDGLPHGWSETTLGVIHVDRSTSIDPSKHPREAFELYSIPAYPAGRPEVVTGSEVGSTKKSLDPGTVVVSKINPRINRVWVVGERNDHRQIGSSEWIPFFPLAGMDPRFLAYFMRQDSFRNYLAANVSGVGGSLMRVKPSTVSPYPFVLAPLPEQRRIVSAIESYFTRLDDAVATLERVQRNLKRYRASVLKAAVEGRLVPTEAELARAEGRSYEPASVLLTRILVERRRRWEEAELAKMTARGKAPKDDKWKAKYVEPAAPDTNELPELPDGWCWATVAQVGETVTGTTPPTKDASYYGDAVPFFKPTDLDAGYNVIEARQFLSRVGAERARVLPANSVLVTCIGATIGKTGLTRVAGATNQQINALIPDEEMREAKFLFWYFASPAGQRDVIGNASSTTLPILNKGRFELLAVTLPPVAEQARIAAEIDRLLSVELALEDATSVELKRLARLRQSILKWAFEGRLVDQDPTDEPASVLLDRIRAERASATDTRPRRARRTRKGAPKS